MGKQRSVQTQVNERGAEIVEVARSFIDRPNQFEWLRALLATYGYDAKTGILLELRSVPDQGCWVHYGMWLTSSGTFLKFVADEAYGQRPLDGSGLLVYSKLEEVSEQISTSEHRPGTGKSFGRLALEALRHLGMSKLK
jgi:hypothetical protein